ncbi:MAG: glycosyltransferase, partial [Bryobacteraceae bacterium]
MQVAFVVAEIPHQTNVLRSPWWCCAAELAAAGIHIARFDSLAAAWQPFDAMILMVWLDWDNRTRFRPERILPVREKFAEYRAAFPSTRQVALNHVDMGRQAYAIPYWRDGDPVLFKTPAYDRSLLAPFPALDIFAYEYVWGQPCFHSGEIKYDAGFIGTPSGPAGYRDRVAAATAKVGIGRCAPDRVPKAEHDSLMGECRIVVCPQGWGENSGRHWDAWKSSKPVLTDRACDSVEMIPGLRLREGEHYLVYDDPAAIPDLVSDWTRPGRRDDLEAIARNGRNAALSYDPARRMIQFFRALPAPAFHE